MYFILRSARASANQYWFDGFSFAHFVRIQLGFVIAWPLRACSYIRILLNLCMVAVHCLKFVYLCMCVSSVYDMSLFIVNILFKEKQFDYRFIAISCA